jgi:GTP cyclohydrolase II
MESNSPLTPLGSSSAHPPSKKARTGTEGVFLPPCFIHFASFLKENAHIFSFSAILAHAHADSDGVPVPEITNLDYVSLTSHADTFGVNPVPISWGHPDPAVRGPVICTVRHRDQRNAIGAHSGSYCIYTGLAVAAGKLNPDYVPNLKLTSPVFNIGPHKSWADPRKIGSLDPFGHLTTDVYGAWLDRGWDIRPTIAVTKAHIDLPECREAIASGRLKPDGKILLPGGPSIVSKAAIEPVWYLPEIARRFGCTESNLRQSIFRMTNGMYPELITRPDIKIFLPPIGNVTVYIWGDPDTIPDEDIELTCRVHDECNGSDVFGSDICTCRPYLTHAIVRKIVDYTAVIVEVVSPLTCP